VNKRADAEARFKEIAEAYEVLGNAEKRKAYDDELRYGALRRDGASGGGGFGDAGFGGGFGFGGSNGGGFGNGQSGGFGGGWQAGSFGSDWSAGGGGYAEDDVLRMFFGGAFNGPMRNAAQATLEITLEQAYRGDQVRVKLGGSDATITIPERCANGTVVTLPGTDAMIELALKAHPVYAEQDGNLIAALQIAPWQAALGGEAQATLPNGSAVKLKIPAGIAAGKRLRLQGKGLKHGDRFGDILFEIELAMPESISAEEKALYSRLAAISGFKAGVKRRTATEAARAEKRHGSPTA